MQAFQRAAAVFCMACIGAELVSFFAGQSWAGRCIKAAAGLYILAVLLAQLPRLPGKVMTAFSGNTAPAATSTAQPDALETEILTEAIDAARLASCGANRQTVRYIVVQSADAVAAVQPLVHWAAYLPPEQGQPKPNELPTAFIAVLQDDNLPGASDVDVGLALGSLTAAAWAHGVGSCIMGAIDRPALTRLLALPDGVRLCYMVALGYPTHASKLVEMQDGSVKYYLDENRGYCVPKRSMDEVLLKTL